VYAVDALPYVAEVAGDLLDAFFGDARRVLAPGGAVAIFNLRYGSSVADDSRELARRSAAHGLRVVVDGVCPFDHWDGRASLLARD
jgi:hypothetical protein